MLWKRQSFKSAVIASTQVWRSEHKLPWCDVLKVSKVKNKYKNKKCTSCVPVVAGRLVGFGRRIRPLVGGVGVGAAPRSGVVAIVTVGLHAALHAAAARPAGA